MKAHTPNSAPLHDSWLNPPDEPWCDNCNQQLDDCTCDHICDTCTGHCTPTTCHNPPS